MITPTECNSFVSRLKALCPGLQNRVFATIPDAALTIDQQPSPVVFVYVEQEDSSANSVINGFRQTLTATVSVELVLRRTASAADLYSEEDTQQLVALRTEVLTALSGWLPSDDSSPVAHVLGQLSQKTAQVIKYIDKFTFTRANRLDF